MAEDKKELTREQQLEIEEKAIEALIQMGVKFSVPLKIHPVKPPKLIAWWNRYFPKHLRNWRDKRLPKNWDVTTTEIPDANAGMMKEVYVRNLVIKPLYLGTIDYLRKLYIQIEYNEEEIQENPLLESKKLFKYVPLMAEIAAVAVVNSSTLADPLSKEVKELQAFFMEHLTVARLKKLSDIVSQMMNPGGFTSSIRSIMGIGMTKPKQEP